MIGNGWTVDVIAHIFSFMATAQKSDEERWRDEFRELYRGRRNRTLSQFKKLTLMMLANRHNADTGQCNPSHALLAKDCGLSDSGVRKAVRELAGLGLIKIHFFVKKGVKLPNQYILNIHLNITESVGHEVTQRWVTW